MTGLVAGVPTVGINGNLLVDGTILADALAVNLPLSAITADLGTVTAGRIQSASGSSFARSRHRRVRDRSLDAHQAAVPAVPGSRSTTPTPGMGQWSILAATRASSVPLEPALSVPPDAAGRRAGGLPARTMFGIRRRRHGALLQRTVYTLGAHGQAGVPIIKAMLVFKLQRGQRAAAGLVSGTADRRPRHGELLPCDRCRRRRQQRGARLARVHRRQGHDADLSGGDDHGAGLGVQVGDRRRARSRQPGASAAQADGFQDPGRPRQVRHRPGLHPQHPQPTARTPC